MRATEGDALGVAVVGAGGIARSAHLPAIARLRGQERLVSVFDTDAAAARAAGEAYGAYVARTLEEALERPGVEAAVVCTPEAYHLEAVAAAAARGLSVLCEKPMAPSLEEADAMIALAEAAGVVLMVGHSRRFTERYRKVYEAVAAGEVGEVRLVRENERRPRPRAGEAGTYWSRGHWTGDPRRSVGAILTNGIHEADLFNWLIGARPVSVVAEERVTRAGGVVADFVSFCVRYDNGAVGASEVNNAAPPGYGAFHEFELYGTRGQVRARDHEGAMVEVAGEGGVRHPEAYGLVLHVQEAYVREHLAFVDSVRHGTPPPVSARDGRLAVAVAVAAAEAARTGRAAAVRAEGGGTGR
ncbi:MAG: Gfo/Idh/MocA family oxidoreductase [Firmicutes bacterium]|nr:Gfo/Idh/MocA family oxidoreductase [Bacillota bacterium]